MNIPIVIDGDKNPVEDIDKLMSKCSPRFGLDFLDGICVLPHTHDCQGYGRICGKCCYSKQNFDQFKLKYKFELLLKD